MSFSKVNVYLSKRNPFEEPPQQRAFYHPGSRKHLSKHERKTALSPDRNAERNKGKDTIKNLNDELFLSGSHVLTNEESASFDNGSSKFDESWPSSERPSLGEGVAEKSQYDFDRFVNLKKRLEFPERDSLLSSVDNSIQEKEMADRGSTLAKYVERFRKGEPKSRAEREEKEGSKRKDFWWLSSSHPGNDSHTTSRHSKSRSPVSPYRVTSKTERLTAAKLASHFSSRLPGDEETRLLQEKADRLLEQSGSSACSSGMIVSTEGLGSSPSSSSVLTDHSEERAYRPAFTRKLRDTGLKGVSSVAPVTIGGQRRPEDDILYQWRLRRKMDLAQESAHLAPVSNKLLHGSVQPVAMDSKLAEFRDKLSHFPSPISSAKPAELSAPLLPQPGPYSSEIQFTPAPSRTVIQDTEQQQTRVTKQADMPQSYPEKQHIIKKKDKADVPVASPTLHRKSRLDEEKEDPPPHLHLMCDILPCPHQQQYFLGSQREVYSESDTDDDRHTSVQYKQYLQAERPHSDYSKQNRDDQEKVTKYHKKDKNKHDSDPRANKNKSRQPSERHFSTQNKTDTDGKIPSNVKEKMSHVNILSEDNRHKLKQKATSENTEESVPNRSRRKLIQDTREITDTPKVPDISSKPPLDSAIGQVVNGYLFETSQSLNSTAESVLSDRENQTSEKTSDKDVDDFSDGEEFSDDSLLQHLRQQRAQFEQQLRDIDVVLSQLDV